MNAGDRGPGVARRAAILLLVVAGLVGSALPTGASTPPTNYAPLNVTLKGPTTAGTLLPYNYTVNATGGPAEALNGSIVGTYTYSASFLALNRTGITFGPAPQGVLVNGTVTLHLQTGNVTESVTLTVQINSTLNGHNATQNVSLLVQVVQPYILAATLQVGSAASVSPFSLIVYLDGTAIGKIPVPTISSGASQSIGFRYVNPSLSPGWHTFSLTLLGQHGLVTFAGGAESYQQSFYVVGPPPDYSVWILGGTATFVAAIVILVLRVGARRGARRAKK